MRTILAAFPLGLLVLFGFLMGDRFRQIYRQGFKRVEKGNAVEVGRVTAPARLRSDLFGFFFCLRSVSVQLKSGRQLRLYVPLHARQPKTGETVAIFEMGEYFGKKRYVGVLYTPHVAVIGGSRV